MKNYQGNFCFPQELEDMILLFLDYCTLKNCREIQSNFVKTVTRYNDSDQVVKNGNLKNSLNNLIWLKDQGEPWSAKTFYLAYKNGNLKILKWLSDNGCPLYNCPENIREWLKERGIMYDDYNINFDQKILYYLPRTMLWF